jgi:DNA-binding PadR family transcriptional regulator
MERELLLLGLLRQEEMHGYRLHEFIERDLALCTDLKKPTAYFLLEKMEKAGWVMRQQQQEGGRPPRQVYQITPEGEAQFQSLLRERLAAYQPTRFVADIALAYADALEPQEVLPLLEKRRQAMLVELEAVRATPKHQGSLQLIIEHQIIHLESELRWFDQVIAWFRDRQA